MLSNTAKKYLIAGVIGTITIAGALAYMQYKKLMNYVIKVKSGVIKTITANLLDLDLTLDFENKSSIAFEIKSQEYEIFIDNKFISNKIKFTKLHFRLSTIHHDLCLMTSEYN